MEFRIVLLSGNIKIYTCMKILNRRGIPVYVH
jgi:hypothetical protein